MAETPNNQWIGEDGDDFLAVVEHRLPCAESREPIFTALRVDVVEVDVWWQRTTGHPEYRVQDLPSTCLLSGYTRTVTKHVDDVDVNGDWQVQVMGTRHWTEIDQLTPVECIGSRTGKVKNWIAAFHA